ncbi:MAG: DUF1320 family protein [Lentimicrobium sp.]|jgi:hypothetical protein|nr:DUF1320 family protein [Lentimicrobium sp.]
MPYITENDYKGRITADLLSLATEDDPDVLIFCDKIAVDSISGYIGHIYDVGGEFAKTATDRNFQLLGWALGIAIYNIFLRLPDVDMPEKIKTEYDQLITDLQDIGRGKFNVNLPPVSGTDPETPDETGSGLRRMGSDKKRSHKI